MTFDLVLLAVFALLAGGIAIGTELERRRSTDPTEPRDDRPTVRILDPVYDQDEERGR